MLRRLMGGFFSGIFTMFWTYPWELIRIQMNLDLTIKGREKLYKGWFDCGK